VEGRLKVAPVRLPLRLPLVQMADWEARRVPWLQADVTGEVEISNRDLLPG